MEYAIYNAAVPPFSDQYGENYKTITSSVFVNKKNCIYLYLCMGTYMNTAGLGIQSFYYTNNTLYIQVYDCSWVTYNVYAMTNSSQFNFNKDMGSITILNTDYLFPKNQPNLNSIFCCGW